MTRPTRASMWEPRLNKYVVGRCDRSRIDLEVELARDTVRVQGVRVHGDHHQLALDLGAWPALAALTGKDTGQRWPVPK